MKNRKTSSPRVTGIVLRYLFFLFLAVSACFYWGFPWLTQSLINLAQSPEAPGASNVVNIWIRSLPDTMIYSVFPAIVLFLVIWGSLLVFSVNRRCSQSMSISTPPIRDIDSASQCPSPVPIPLDRSALANHDRRIFLYLLRQFQQEGRLVDFFQENLDLYEDAQIGAAVRSIHDSCRKIMDRHIRPQPILDQEEGESITLNKGFDADMIKLIGNVGDHPPFHGAVRHKGWKAGKRDVPELSGDPDPSVITPAEVELS